MKIKMEIVNMMKQLLIKDNEMTKGIKIMRNKQIENDTQMPELRKQNTKIKKEIKNLNDKIENLEKPIKNRKLVISGIKIRTNR